ncbi:hypothetical protein [Aestuariivirga sp.]|uniref:hypothetical protein n=1 Tax=Aestuariivirga sp. TaxID=2650926 RepID=UPI00391C7BE1
MSQQQNFKSTIERADEIAASGEAPMMEHLGRLLGQEGYALNMVTSRLLIKQLRQRWQPGREPGLLLTAPTEHAWGVSPVRLHRDSSEVDLHPGD